MEEKELIRRLQNGDEAAYRVLVDMHQSSVLNTCFRFVPDQETAEDLTQEVFIEVSRSIGAFRSESKLSTWLYRIAITKSLDHLKSQKRKKRSGFLKNIFSETESDVRSLAIENEGPQHILENEERRRVLSRAIDSLPENQKVAFTLSKYDGLTTKEIADILNSTVSSVESLVFRAKSNLKKKLYKYYKTDL
jgi:RNA polymerase sigma-70 factor, ECF subfamily